MLQQEAWNGRWALSLLSEDVFAMVSHAWLLEAIFSDLSLLFILLAVTVVWNVLGRAMLCVWNAFKSECSILINFTGLLRWKNGLDGRDKQLCHLGFDVCSTLEEHPKQIQKLRLSSAHVLWALSLCQMHQGTTGHHTWHLTLYPISECVGWPRGCPKLFSMAHWSMVTGEANHWNVTRPHSARSSLRSIGLATCKPSTICHRREIVHALGVFISQPRLTLCKHEEQWRKARRVDVASYMWDTCSY